MTLELITAITLIILFAYSLYARPRRVRDDKEDDSDIHLGI